MGANTTRSTFRVRPVLASIWAVIRSHYAILGLLAVVLHFVAWRFVGELRRSLVEYAAEGFRLDLPKLAGGLIATWSAAVPDPLRDAVDPLFWEYLSTTAAVDSLYLVLMQVAFTTLMSAGLEQPGGWQAWSREPGRALVLARFKRADLAFDVLRSLGVLVAVIGLVVGGFAVMVLAVLIFEHEYLRFLHSVKWIENLFLLALAVGYILLLVVVGTRWTIGVPMTIVENTSVLESLRRSWRLTRHCWLKLFVVSQLVPAPFAGLAAALPDGETASFGAALTGWGLTIVGTTVGAAVFPVCYYYLRNAGAGIPTPDEPAEPPAGRADDCTVSSTAQ